MNKIMIEVDIDEVLNMKAKLRYINLKPLDQITWTRDGKPVEFSKQDIEDFKFTGLNNTDFIDIWVSGQLGKEHMED